MATFPKYYAGALVVAAIIFSPVALTADPTVKHEGNAQVVREAYELLESGQTELALEGFNKALETDATHLTARLGQAMIFQEQLRYEDAFKSYDLIVQNYPAHAFAWNGRGLAAFNLENFDVALNSFQRATADQPINGFFYESLAWTHLCLGDYNKAASSAKRATLMYNQNGETAAYPLLIAYFSQLEAGELDDARRTLGYAQNNRHASGAWPTPVFDYLAGNLNAPQLISYVMDTAQETEAHTYIGMKLRATGEDEKAEKHLNWVAQCGDERVFEYTLARTLQASDKVALLAP